jgi:hypothetical protein
MSETTDRDAALASIEAIQKVLVRTTRYTHISAAGILLGGTLASGAALAGMALSISPREQPGAFLALWGVTFSSAVAAGLFTCARKARAGGESFWNRKLQFVAAGFLPAPVLGFVLTALLWDIGRLDLAPGVWAGIYGTGILAVAIVLDWEFHFTAWCFIVCSAAALFLLRAQPHLALLFSFGGIHLSLGAYRLIKEHQWRRHPALHSSSS